jgi:hypothetical protein
MTKEKLGQIFREITDPFAKNLVQECERPAIDWNLLTKEEL